LDLFFVLQKKSWMNSHAGLPFADHLHDDLFRIYFSTRDSNYRANIGYIEINILKPKKILKISKKPLFELGKPGSFDDNGVMGSCMIDFRKKKFLYYIGWNKGITYPFRWAIGLAISNDGGKTFKKFSEGPILDRNYVDPFFVASPMVLKEGRNLRMWYLSGINSKIVKGKPHIPYHIKYAESTNGIDWNRSGRICISHKNSDSRISRVTILKEKNLYTSWYGYANGNYKIGYATSKDGLIWARKDEQAGIEKAFSGWDSKMIEYPYVFKHKGNTFMIYNGNNYGESGFGLAILENND